MYSLPYSAINMWSSENAGTLDWNPEVKLWTRAGHIKVKLSKGAEVRRLDSLIAWAVLKHWRLGPALPRKPCPHLLPLGEHLDPVPEAIPGVEPHISVETVPFCPGHLVPLGGDPLPPGAPAQSPTPATVPGERVGTERTAPPPRGGSPPSPCRPRSSGTSSRRARRGREVCPPLPSRAPGCRTGVPRPPHRAAWIPEHGAVASSPPPDHSISISRDRCGGRARMGRCLRQARSRAAGTARVLRPGR